MLDRRFPRLPRGRRPALARRVFVASALFGATCAGAAESDVHYGLTQFLALQAGFTSAQAAAIALGDQRVESGDMRFLALGLDYGCYGKDAELSAEVAVRNFPSARSGSGDGAERAVVAGGPAARADLDKLAGMKASQTGFRLFQLGEALHVLQASYLHDGVPEVPRLEPYLACDATLAWGHPKARGGWSSHAADLTHRWPAETMRMAQATYEALVRYPPIAEVARTPADWPKVAARLDGFVKAATKLDKQRWFEANGIADTAFLAGTSLPDGAKPFTLEWDGRRLPALPSIESRQHGVEPGLLAFFSKFFADWLRGTEPEALADAQVAASAPRPGGKEADAARVELAARLRLWMLRDHGAAAALAHEARPLSKRQLQAVADLAKPAQARASYAKPTDGVFPLVTNEKTASPLLPFIVRPAAASTDGAARAVAIAKLRHAPYDSVGVVAENVGGAWRVVALVAMVDH